MPSRSTQDWSPWTGGEMPVDGMTRVRVRLRIGIVASDFAFNFCWEHSDKLADIIAYRVKEPE